MKPEQPMFLITMQIPVRPDTDVSEVLDVIGQQLSEAVRKVQEHAEKQSYTKRLEPIVDDGWKETVMKETQEDYSEDTGSDLLASMGYRSEA